MDKEMMMWIANGEVTKGELDFKTGTVSFYDKHDNLLLRRKGLTRKAMREIKKQIELRLNKRSGHDSVIGYYYL